jgi:hypothetical protein
MPKAGFTAMFARLLRHRNIRVLLDCDFREVRSLNQPRQATVFRVVKGAGADTPELTKVFHLTNPAKCGVRFDYGKRYVIVAAKKASGELETSYCLMPAAD